MSVDSAAKPTASLQSGELSTNYKIYALLTFMAFNLWAAFHYWQAGRYIEADLKRAASAST